MQISLGGVLRDLLAGFDDDLAGPVAAGRIDDVVDRDLAFDLARRCGRRRSSRSSSRRTRGSDRRSVLYLGSIARSSVMAENLPLWSMRTVSVSFFVTFSSIQLPRSGMMRQLCSLRSLVPSISHDEVDAGAAVQLAHHDALGAVDDELAAAEHDRHVAQVDFFLDRLLFVQPQPDAERPAVGQPQLAAFVRRRSAACPARSADTRA